jgi:hypothetical protein
MATVELTNGLIPRDSLAYESRKRVRTPFANNPSGPAVMHRTNKAGHMIALAPPSKLPNPLSKRGRPHMNHAPKQCKLERERFILKGSCSSSLLKNPLVRRGAQ